MFWFRLPQKVLGQHVGDLVGLGPASDGVKVAALVGGVEVWEGDGGDLVVPDAAEDGDVGGAH